MRPARAQARGQSGGEIDPPLGQHLLQHQVLVAGGARVGAEEERGLAVLDPGGELVHLGVERVEQDDAAQAVADASVVRGPRGGRIAAAVGDDDHRQALEGPPRALVAVQLRETNSASSTKRRKWPAS